MAVGTRFIDRSRKFLKTNYLPKIEAAVRPLSPADVWWRPNDASNVCVSNSQFSRENPPHLCGVSPMWTT